MTSKPAPVGIKRPSATTTAPKTAPKSAEQEWSKSESDARRRSGTSADGDERASARAAKEAARDKGFSSMMWGLGWFVLGIVITVGSFMAASSGSGGGRYVVTYGFIIWGFIKMVGGFFSWVSNR